MKRTDTHRHTDTQTHRHTDTQTHRHTNTDTQTHRHTDTQTFTDTCGCAVCHAHRLKSRKQNTWLSCLKLTASMQRPTSTSNKRLRFACDCILVYFSTCGCFRCSLCCLLLLSPGPLSHTHTHTYPHTHAPPFSIPLRPFASASWRSCGPNRCSEISPLQSASSFVNG